MSLDPLRVGTLSGLAGLAARESAPADPSLGCERLPAPCPTCGTLTARRLPARESAGYPGVPAPQGPVSSPVPDGAHPAPLGGDCGTTSQDTAALVARARTWAGGVPGLVADLADALERAEAVRRSVRSLADCWRERALRAERAVDAALAWDDAQGWQWAKDRKVTGGLEEPHRSLVLALDAYRSEPTPAYTTAEQERDAALARAEAAEARVAALEGVVREAARCPSRVSRLLMTALDAAPAPPREGR